MKILYLLFSMNNGGAERLLVNTVNNLSQLNDYEVHVFLTYKEGELLNKIHPNVKVKYLCWGKQYEEYKKLPRLYRFLYNIYRSVASRLMNLFPSLIYKLYIHEDYDAIISHSGGNINYFLANCKKNVQKCMWIHTDITKADYFYFKDHEFIINNKIDIIVCVAETVKNTFLQVYPATKDKVYTIYNPIETNKIIDMSNAHINDIVKNKITLIAVGRLEKVKGFDRLIKSVKILLDRELDFDLWIIGDGSERQKLEIQINDLELQNNVKLLGYKENPYPYIKMADIYVLSSYYEGLSSTLIEALILEKAILSTECSGVREILDDGKCGLIVKNSDEALLSGLEKIIKNDELRDRYVINMSKKKYSFDIKTFIEKMTYIMGTK